MPQNIYEVLWIFMIYAFVGWCVEVAYAALNSGKFVNRGFLNGPYCPIYGCGVVIVVAVLTPIKDNFFVLFIGSFVLTTTLEYITGFVLEKVFHNKWWDYSDTPFNLSGYVCLKFSILWGLACTFVMDVVHPMIYKGITAIPHMLGVVLLSILMVTFVVDVCVTISTILKFNKRLRLMNEMAATIHKISDEIGENIYENVSGVMEKSEEFQETHAELIDKISDTKESLKELPENAKAKLTEAADETKMRILETMDETRGIIEWKTESTRDKLEDAMDSLEENRKEREAAREKWREEKRQEMEELTAKYEKLFEEKNGGIRRLMKAFPDMKSREYEETLEKVKIYFKIKLSEEENSDTAQEENEKVEEKSR